MKILFIGDIVGNPGRKAVKAILPALKKERSIDFCIANGENAAGGSGITATVAQDLYNSGIDCITLGNHTWSKRDITDYIDTDAKMIRPANFFEGLPGKGSTVLTNLKGKIGVVNVMGRVYMEGTTCPFRAAEKEIEYLKNFVKVILVDIHAEATSEKNALAWYLDGRVSGVVGTHTHVQTADERILPRGTAYLTDVGMTGPFESVLGVEKDIIIEKLMNNMPIRFEVAKGTVQFNAVAMETDDKNGKTIHIERISQLIEV